METVLNSDVLLFGLIIFFLLNSLLATWFAIQNKRLRKKYLRLVEGSQVDNLENIILSTKNEVENLKTEIVLHQKELNLLQDKLKHMKSHVYIHRYSAFSDELSGLSYSVVFLDDYMNGVVITGLYNREQSYTYAKPIENGQSKYKLSPEEWEAIRKTIETSR